MIFFNKFLYLEKNNEQNQVEGVGYTWSPVQHYLYTADKLGRLQIAIFDAKLLIFRVLQPHCKMLKYFQWL